MDRRRQRYGICWKQNIADRRDERISTRQWRKAREAARQGLSDQIMSVDPWQVPFTAESAERIYCHEEIYDHLGVTHGSS